MRKYTVTFEKVSVSAVQDLFQIIGASGKMLRIKRVAVSCVDPASTLVASQMLALRARILPATVSNGSGGSAPTPDLTDLGDPAASFTAKANNTSKATTSGTAHTVLEDGTHLYAPYSFPFPFEVWIGNNQSFVFELITAPSAAVTLSGQVDVEEFAG